MTSQPAALPFERPLREIGARFDPEVLRRTREIYQPTLDLSKAGEEQTDVAYGAHARHRLDIYHAPVRPQAVVMFVHGGGFVAGDKNSDGVFYVNLGRWLARKGFTAALPNYRLAPEHPWPAGAEDVGAALAWVRENLAATNEPPLPLVLWGQSAGAHHVATWLFDPRQGGRKTAGHLHGVMLMSGLYEVSPPLSAGALAYFGTDESLYIDRSPLSHVITLDVPIWLGLAELDPDGIAHHTHTLHRVLATVQATPLPLHHFHGHNHVSTVQSLGSPQTTASEVVLAVLRSMVKDRQP